MRILIYTVIRMNGTHGARVNLETLAGKLAKRGHQVTLFAPAAPGERPRFPFEVVYLRPEGRGLIVQKVLQDLMAGVELLRLVKGGRAPQVVLSRFGISTVVLPLLCKLLGIRYIADVHGSYEQTLLNEHRVPRALLPIFLSVEKLNYLLSDRIITVSDELSALVPLRRGEGRVHTVPNGIDPALFSSIAPDAAFRERTRGGKRMVFGFVGMFDRWLGVCRIVEAFALLKRERPLIAREVKVVLVGDGSERCELERLIDSEGLGEMVTITGWVEHDQVPRYLHCFDVALAPYVSDANTRGWGSSLKMMEYLAAGRWTIASEMTVVTPIIRETSAGYILPNATPAAILEGILHAWEHRDELAEGAARGRRYVREKLSWDVRIRRIEEILQEALADPPQQAG